ncbi:hypothetical protein TNIN_320731 [Trichonephila inaurata madagascariensis]|uniref:Uncharacterized protein n=1 Tax=Trichonephila inaurata madagascariensis TaxID=2747483 RepID=A0A8X6Y4N0_9ARAC|nr:hypothetical protein TNIN_320731 [Trichonephila inaurata madagascariensis]
MFIEIIFTTNFKSNNESLSTIYQPPMDARGSAAERKQKNDIRCRPNMNSESTGGSLPRAVRSALKSVHTIYEAESLTAS